MHDIEFCEEHVTILCPGFWRAPTVNYIRGRFLYVN